MPSSRKGKSPNKSREIGRGYEEMAARFFSDNGYQILHKNYRAGPREIDLVVQKGTVIAFVEVKASKSIILGHPAERINRRKIANLTLAAERYLQEFNIEGCDLRFDVITFTNGKLEHYPDAFSALSDN